VKIGLCMFPTGYAMHPGELAQAAEAHGFESLFFPEHTHIPTSRRSPFPSGGELPQEYAHSLDPFVALSAAAMTTKRLLLGTGVCLVIERDPIILAKEVASLDYLCNGRLLFGIGGGWNREEMENHGTDPRRRWKVLRERIEAMQAIWTTDEAEYHGEFVNFDPIWQWPKPMQEPHPPILVGGDGPNTLPRVVRYGDGWMPIGRDEDTDFRPRMDELNRLADAAGRGPIPVTMFLAPPKPGLLETYARAGIERVVIGLPSAPAEVVLSRLERHAELARQFA
jgi:probable F420-dependent oxidoreductase